jgi:type VI secretion system FHA domain protein
MLVLSVLRCPDAVPPETKRVSGGEFKIGRGQDNDWIMPDPDRMLSKRHCVIAFRNGGWALADTSTNGTFLNRDADPIGPGQVRGLNDGDRIRFGAYEIEVRLEAEAYAPPGKSFGGASPFDDPFGDDVFATKPVPQESFSSSAFGNDPLFGGPSPQQSVTMPGRYDAMAPPSDDDFFSAPSQPDHSPAFSDAFKPPPLSYTAVPPAGFTAAPPLGFTAAPPPGTPNLIPDDDWDLDLPLSPKAAPPAPMPAPPLTPPVYAPTEPTPQAFDPPAAAPFAAPAAPQPLPVAPPQPLPVPQYQSPPAAPPPGPAAPMPLPLPSMGASPFAEPDDLAPRYAPPPPPPLSAPPPAAPPLQAAPAPAAAPAAAPPATQSSDALLTAFLEGAGMAGARPENPEAAMRALGAALRATVSGIRQALIARSSIKGEFRIEQTMIRARGNNPLKFSADDNDALGALLGVGRRTDVTPEAAISDALRDMRLHELATVAAMQDAVRALLAQLDPARLQTEGGAMTLLPAQKKARAFEAYEKLHDNVTRALADDFDSVFGKSFARAYEIALRDISAKDS